MKNAILVIMSVFVVSVSQAGYRCHVNVQNVDSGSIRKLGTIYVDMDHPSANAIVLNRAGDKITCGSFIDDGYRALICAFTPAGMMVTMRKGFGTAKAQPALKSMTTGKITNATYMLMESSGNYAQFGIQTPAGQTQDLYITECFK
jgi:hypothetical protein